MSGELVDVTFRLRVGLGGNDRPGHWGATARARKRERKATALGLLTVSRWWEAKAAAKARLAEGQGLLITLTRISPGPGLDGHDNLPASLKGVADQVVSWLGLKSDRDTRLTFRYDQGKGPWSVRVVVTAREEE